MYPPCFVVSYVDVDQVPTLQYNLNQIEGIYKDKPPQRYIRRYTEFQEHGDFRLPVVFLLLLVSLFVIINTINIAIFSRRQEIGIMRYRRDKLVHFGSFHYRRSAYRPYFRRDSLCHRLECLQIH